MDCRPNGRKNIKNIFLLTKTVSCGRSLIRGSAVCTEKFNKQQEKLTPFNKETIPHRENVSGILN